MATKFVVQLVVQRIDIDANGNESAEFTSMKDLRICEDDQEAAGTCVIIANAAHATGMCNCDDV